MSRELVFSITKKDLNIDYFSGTGGGGQHRNKHQNCVRMYHKESGVRSTGQSSKERKSNLKEAFNSLVKDPKFKIWLKQKTYEVINKTTLEEQVKKEMSPENLRVEYKTKDGWVGVKEKKSG
jgi:protein subunit release factor A